MFLHIERHNISNVYLKKQVAPYFSDLISYLFKKLSSYNLTGRNRFYKNVDIKRVPAPWFTESTSETFEYRNNDITDSKHVTLKSIKKSLQPPLHNSSLWYGVTLDDRPQPILTPRGRTIAVPSKTLAMCIANEWNQISYLIQPTQLPLTTLVCTVLDYTTNHTYLANIHSTIQSYLFHDTTCFWADEHEEQLLYLWEKKYWSPIHSWLNMSSEYALNTLHPTCIQSPLTGHTLYYSRGGQYVKNHHAQTSGTQLKHPISTSQAVESYVHSLDSWGLVALQSLTTTLKSLLLAIAIVHGIRQQAVRSYGSKDPVRKLCNKDITLVPYFDSVEDAIMASRLEEEIQIEHWGLVEGGHDYDRLNCNINVRAACILLGSIWGNL